jgi:hypothetical protein
MSPAREERKLGKAAWLLLRSIVAERDGSLLGLVDGLGDGPITDDQREALQHLLIDEVLEEGLRGDCEANRYGREVDDIIGRLSRF